MSPSPVPEDGRITESGEYVLESDRRVQGVTPPSEAMIRIEADDVALDGRGHAVVGKGVSDTTAIATAARGTLQNLTVEDVRVVEWEVGLHFENVERTVVRDVDAAQNSYGLLLEQASETTVEDSVVRDNLVGVFLGRSVSEHSAAGSDVRGNHLGDVVREDECD
jgi:nitrous oxidase accessory protein NosD